jgi:hypothetical protein
MTMADTTLQHIDVYRRCIPQTGKMRVPEIV